MKNAKQLLPVLAVLLCVSLSCTFVKDKLANLNSGSVKAPSIPPFDPNGPIASPGAYVIRIMAEDEPTLAALADQVEAAERKMMKQTIDENRPKSQTGNTDKKFMTSPPEGAKSIPISPAAPAAAYLMLQSGEISLPKSGDGVLFGGFTGFLKGMLASALKDETFNKKDSKTENVEGGTSTMNMEVGQNPDGSTVFEIGIVTETQKNGVKARTEARSRIEGQDCPNAEGQVPFTIKMRLSGQSGNSRYEQEVTAFVRLVVDDNADIANTTIDINQGTTRTRRGQPVYVESALTYRRNAGESEGTLSNARWGQHTDNATTEDYNEAAGSGYDVAFGAANAAIGAAESAWQGGACIKIDAKSPGTVGLNSSTSFPVKVVHKKEGTELTAKLKSELEGTASIDPALLPRTPGTLTYVAPGEPAKTATIKLTAACRRGRAVLYLKADTGSKAYRVEGSSNGVAFKGVICGLINTFSLDATFPGGNATVSFLHDGTTITRGGGNGCTMAGEGTYKLDIADDDTTGTLNWTSTDKLTCPVFGGNSRTTSFSVTLKPAPDVYCN